MMKNHYKFDLISDRKIASDYPVLTIAAALANTYFLLRPNKLTLHKCLEI